MIVDFLDQEFNELNHIRRILHSVTNIDKILIKGLKRCGLSIHTLALILYPISLFNYNLKSPNKTIILYSLPLMP